MKYVDTTGRVEKFQRKYNWDKRKKAGEATAPSEATRLPPHLLQPKPSSSRRWTKAKGKRSRLLLPFAFPCLQDGEPGA